MTVPVGVLKAEKIKFQPALPESKHAAIHRLDMGNLEKVVLRFDSVFWTDFVDQAGLLIDADEPGAREDALDEEVGPLVGSAVFLGQELPQMISLQRIEGEARIDHPGAVIAAANIGLVRQVMLVFDFADNLF